MAQQQQIGITPQQEEQMGSQIAASASAAVTADGKQISAQIDAENQAYFAQNDVGAAAEEAQATIAAGGSPGAQDAPLTDNPPPPIPPPQLQNFSADLSNIPLPSLPSLGSATSAPVNDAFTRYWNDSVGQLTSGPSPSFTAAFDQMLASDTPSGNGDIAFSGTPSPWAIAGIPNPIAGLEDLANGLQSAANDVLNSSIVQRAIGGIKSDVNNLVGAGPASLLTRLATEPEPNIGMPLSVIDPGAYQEQQQLSQLAASQVYSALAWNPSNLEQLQGYNAATEATTIASLALGGYGLLDAGVSALRSSYQLSDLFAGSAGRIGSTPLSAQLGQLDLSLFESAPGPEIGDGTAVGSGGGTTTVYRVEGAPNQRIVIDASGNVSLAPGNDTMLFLNFGQEGRAAQYYAQKIAGGLPDVQIKSFEVDNSFFEQIQNDAVPQEFGRQFPDSPQLVDTTKAPNQYGIPGNYFDQLTNSIVPGSGQTNVNPLDLFPPPPSSR